ncbi:MAG: hypothetical protein PVJ05_02710 [Candidatus Thorarchaeota archaeon]|jgi:hypothetical protein
MQLERKIVWIIKQTNDITKWYMKQSGIFENHIERIKALRKDDLLWYEGHVANYVAKHAHMFSKTKLKNVWFEFQLGDKRTFTEIEEGFKPDLLLHFEKELWIVEVKYPDYWPDLENQSETRGDKKQLESYGQQLVKLITGAGWFKGIEQVRLAFFYAYKKKKHPHTEQLIEASKWPVEREDSFAFSP